MKELLWKESYKKTGELTDCFFAYFLIKNELYSVHREHKVFSLKDWPKNKSDNHSKIVLTKYQNKNPKNKTDTEVLIDGNDPRVVSNDKKAFILVQGALYSENIYSLVVLPEKKIIHISLGENVKAGKNWQPLLYNDELYVVDSIAPFYLNKINLKTGIVSRVKETKADLVIRAQHDNYSILRGGSNAIIEQDIMWGIGHATTKPYEHIPYIWRYNSKKNSISTSFISIYQYFIKLGYGIVDPTSFFEWDKDTYAISFSCSQRDWFYDQWFLNTMFLIKKKDFVEFNFHMNIKNKKQRSLLFIADNLDTLIKSKTENTSRNNNRKKGCLVCGPNKPIDLTKTWTVTLSYSSKNSSIFNVGLFDIYLTIDEKEHQANKTIIYGTKGKIKNIKLKFGANYTDKTGLIQTRVFSNLLCDVTVYHFELTYEN